MVILKASLAALLLGYLGICLLARLTAERRIFPVPPPGYAADDPRITYLEAPGQERLATLLVTPPGPAAGHRGLVLMNHGNGVDLGSSGRRVNMFIGMGYAVLQWDYPGYGHSTGVPGEAAIYAAVERVMAHATGTLGYEPGRVIVFGSSLGSAPALHLAVHHPIRALIIESGFLSIFRTVWPVRILPWDYFDNLSRIGRLQAPLLIIHGTADEIVPGWHGRTLFRKASVPKEIFAVEGADHNNLLETAGPRYQIAVEQFIEKHAEVR